MYPNPKEKGYQKVLFHDERYLTERDMNINRDVTEEQLHLMYNALMGSGVKALLSNKNPIIAGVSETTIDNLVVSINSGMTTIDNIEISSLATTNIYLHYRDVELVKNETIFKNGKISVVGADYTGITLNIEELENDIMYDPMVYEQDVTTTRLQRQYTVSLDSKLEGFESVILLSKNQDKYELALETYKMNLSEQWFVFNNETEAYVAGYLKTGDRVVVWNYKSGGFSFGTVGNSGDLLLANGLYLNVSLQFEKDIKALQSGKLDRGSFIGSADDLSKKEDTIDSLKASSKYKVGDVVEVLGYYTAGDGAGHKRKIEATDDGSGVQLANGLWANIVHSGEVNVSWFGAKGDGVTDDTDAIDKTLTSDCESVVASAFSRFKTTKLLKVTKNKLCIDLKNSSFTGFGLDITAPVTIVRNIVFDFKNGYTSRNSLIIRAENVAVVNNLNFKDLNATGEEDDLRHRCISVFIKEETLVKISNVDFENIKLIARNDATVGDEKYNLRGILIQPMNDAKNLKYFGTGYIRDITSNKFYNVDEAGNITTKDAELIHLQCLDEELKTYTDTRIEIENVHCIDTGKRIIKGQCNGMVIRNVTSKITNVELFKKDSTGLPKMMISTMGPNNFVDGVYGEFYGAILNANLLESTFRNIKAKDLEMAGDYTIWAEEAENTVFENVDFGEPRRFLMRLAKASNSIFFKDCSIKLTTGFTRLEQASNMFFHNCKIELSKEVAMRFKEVRMSNCDLLIHSQTSGYFGVSAKKLFVENTNIECVDCVQGSVFEPNAAESSFIIINSRIKSNNDKIKLLDTYQKDSSSVYMNNLLVEGELKIDFISANSKLEITNCNLASSAVSAGGTGAEISLDAFKCKQITISQNPSFVKYGNVDALIVGHANLVEMYRGFIRE